MAVAPDGRVLIADRYNNRIRAVETNGVITTFAGTGEYGFGGDGGAATNALLNYPRGVAVDDLGRVFIADTENARLRMVATNGLIRTLAGTGNYGFSGDGGPALAAMLDGPAGIDVDATRGILFADVNNQRIRRVRLSAGLLQGIPQETGVFPMTLWASDGVTSNDQAFVLTIEKACATVTLSDLDYTYDGTEKVPTYGTAPSGLVVRFTYNGVTNPPVNAGVYVVTGLVEEANWQGFNTATLTIQKAMQTIVFPAIGDQALSNRIGLAAAVTNSGYAATFTVASGHASIAGGTNLTFQRVGPVSIVASRAGDANYLAAAPVTNSFMVYSPPVWMAEPVTNGSCSTPYRYRLVARDPDSWLVDFGGSLPNPFGLETNVDERVVHAVAGTGVGAYDGEGAFATNHAVYRPSNVSLTSNGYVYVADQYNHRIRRIAPDGYVETVAGTGLPGSSGDGGAATNAQLRFPADSVQDAEGNLYIADRDNHRIRKVDASGTIRTIAGTGLPGFSGDNGPATNAALSFPTGLALDEAGAHLYIADRDNHRIRRLSLSNQVIVTVAGTGLPGNTGDGGAATNARLRNPTDIVLDGAGNLYLADQNNHKIRRVDTNGLMAAVAGTGVFGYSGDGGPATNAALNKPYGVALDGVGRLYISDTDNHRIRQLDLGSGVIRTIAGTGSAGYNGDEILATNAQFNAPYGVAADALGHVFVADNNNQRIRRLDVGSVYLAGTPPASGSYPIELTATDRDSRVTGQTFTIEVAKVEASVYLAGLSHVYDEAAKSATATTMPAGLTVTFTYDGGDLAPVNAGSYAVTGTVDDTCYQGSAAGTLIIHTAEQTTAINFAPTSPQTYRTTNALDATGGSGTGTITFAMVSGPGMLVDGTNLVLTSGTGTVLIRATKNADANWYAASVTGSVTAAKADQTIDFGPLANQAITTIVGLQGTASSGLAVSFEVSSGPAQITGGTNVSFSATGTVTIVASQVGDANFLAASNVTQSLDVYPVIPEITDPFHGSVEASDAAMGATIVRINGAAVTERGLVWSLVADFDPLTSAKDGQTGSFGAGTWTQQVTGLTSGLTNYYRAYAVNIVGTSYTAEVHVHMKPEAPVAGPATDVQPNRFTAHWSAARGATNYLLEVSKEEGFGHFVPGYESRVLGEGGEHTVTGLTAGTWYHYRLRAENQAGLSTNSALVSVLTTPRLTVLTWPREADQTIPQQGSYSVNPGTPTQVVTWANSGYQFAFWEGTSGLLINDAYARTTTVTLLTSSVLTAYYQGRIRDSLTSWEGPNPLRFGPGPWV